jgi:hypothetical protein
MKDKVTSMIENAEKNGVISREDVEQIQEQTWNIDSDDCKKGLAEKKQHRTIMLCRA